jgi:uncharacterized integral membrane protein
MGILLQGSALRSARTQQVFHAAGTSLLSGRAFTWHDDKNSPPVAVVNREFARRIFGSPTSAMGKYFKRRDGTRTQVVGIVEDGKYENLAEDPQPAMFLPILQQPPANEMSLVVRSNRDPQQLLGLMGAMLAVTGIFGVAAYSVSKRMRELGIRIALGAQRPEVLLASLGRAFKLLAFGSVAGLFVGILASRVLASIVYQATPRDPLVLGGAVLTMLLLGLLATWIPARRALKVDPLLLLREE